MLYDQLMKLKEAVIQVINRIPRGKVASYGQISKVITPMIQKAVSAQLVGWQLSSMPKDERGLLPWRRVVNRQGKITSTKLGEKGHIQKLMLQDDGILVYDYQVPMERYQVDQEVLTIALSI